MASEISQMSDSSIVIIQGTVGLYTVATRCHTCFAVTLKYTFISYNTSTLFVLFPSKFIASGLIDSEGMSRVLFENGSSLFHNVMKYMAAYVRMSRHSE